MHTNGQGMCAKAPIIALRDETLRNVDNVERTHNFWVGVVSDLPVASDANELQEQCEILEILDVSLDALKNVVKKAEALKAILQNKILVKGFDTVGVPAQWVGENEFAVEQRITGSFADKDQGYNWLEEIGEGSLITRTVHAQTLSAFLKRYVEETATTPPDFVKVNTMDYVKIKRAKSNGRKRKAA